MRWQQTKTIIVQEIDISGLNAEETISAMSAAVLLVPTERRDKCRFSFDECENLYLSYERPLFRHEFVEILTPKIEQARYRQDRFVHAGKQGSAIREAGRITAFLAEIDAAPVETFA